MIIHTAVEIISPGYWEDFDDWVFGIMMLPFGVLSTYLLYQGLEATWKKNSAKILIDPFDLEEKY